MHMKPISTERVLKRIAALANGEENVPPFDGASENSYFWERVKQLHEEGYFTNIYITKDNMGKPIGIILYSQPVLTTKGEDYLASSRKNKWWCKVLFWLTSAVGAVGIYLLEKLCDNLI